ncbi:hypothetical protein CAL29_22130 [Bordetella genomosp. 10]|uniref:Lipoprotein n=1 Tax=Bordetella genomosp. 10 TaxID=1416804 RepID=A0A261S0J9_9BORD|nr:hypothetical protein [Bordetella genomosp. 10]OZI30695.1 hypothetical protein CAL29_22130 [Bordetella genomosp. 10]
MQIRRLALIAGLVAVLAGCATTPKPLEPQSDADFKQSISEAEKTFESQGSDAAVAQFESIAQRNPTRGQPWSYIAKIRFDEHKYGEAIVAADEALNRDPTDFIAKSVRAVGGLRVALQSLSDLRADSLLAGNARNDAVALAQSLRDTLGQDVLFPEGQKPRRATGPVRRPPPKPADGATPAPAAGATAAPATSAAPASSTASQAADAAIDAAKAAAPAKPAVPATPSVPSTGAAAPAPNPFGNLLK